MRGELVDRARRGDRDAFDVLMLEVIDGLHAVARLIAQDVDVAEDAVQEALVRCWRDLPTLRDTERFEPWLRRLVVNSVTDEFRKRRRRDAVIRLLPALDHTIDGSTAIANRDELERAFRTLSIEHRTIVVLHHYIGLSVPELATTLGIPDGTAKSRLHYAMAAMRATLEADARDRTSGRATA